MHKFLIQICLTACLCFCLETVNGQSTQTIAYTTKDGLPSNSIYKTVLDTYGFLWIATENGLAKFDGKNFKTYTTVQGLPDNDITDIFIDSNGRIWVTPFRRTPAYFNPVKDRFENEETDAELKKIDLANTNRASVLRYGGMAFCNNRREFFIYKNGKTIVYKDLPNSKSAMPFEKIIEYRPNNYLIISADSIRVFNGNMFTKTIPLLIKSFYCEYFNQNLYIGSGNTISKYRVEENGNILLLLQKFLPFDLSIFCRAGKDLIVTTSNKTTYPVDTATLELKNPLEYNTAVRSVLEDRHGNIWIATIDKGLVKMQQKRISSFTITDKLLNDEITQTFNCLAIINNKICVGNNYGELLIYDGVYDVKKRSLISGKNKEGVVRKIIETPDKIFVSCQSGSFLMDKKSLAIVRKFEGQKNYATKYALQYNDSVLLLGNHSVVCTYNILSDKIIDQRIKRVTALGLTKNKTIYIGSNDGLYRWDKDSLFYFGKTYRALSYKVNTILSTSDDLLWVGLGSDSLLVMQKDVVIKSMALGDIIPGNVCKSLCSNQPGVIWLGTNRGLNKIQYEIKNSTVTFTNTYFGLIDGLIGEQVNDMSIDKDTLYAATTGGISFLPTNLTLPVSEIKTFITQVLIQGKDTTVQRAYKLPYDKNNISIYFSSADLTGYYPLFEYRRNDDNWIKTDKNNIELSLAPGNYIIQIRGIKRDGTPSSQIESITILIKTPFWKSGVFWTSVVLILFALIFMVMESRNRQKRKAAVEKVITEKKLTELEMQALKAQINPHFVFNCLNSIKGFIFEKDFIQADKYLDKFADLMRSTIDNSDAAIISLQNEIDYLDNYLQLEKLRFDDKFEYSIWVSESLNKANYFVPAMLLQPYVENAIRHGIRFLETRKGHIKISVTKENNFLVCEIEDNGIGFTKAAELKSKMHIEYQSKGMNISKRRADLYRIEHWVTNITDSNGHEAGTLITIKIPIEFNK